MMPKFDNIEFDGPFDIDGIDEIPDYPGVYLICTEASGGLKIIGVYEGENVKMSIRTNPKRECWERNMSNGPNAYKKKITLTGYSLNEPDKDKREQLCRRIVSNRPYRVVCNDLIRDDF